MILSRKARDQFGRQRNLAALDQGFRGFGQAGGIMAQSRAAEEAAALNRRRMALAEEDSQRADDSLAFQQDRVLRPQNEAMEKAYGPLKYRQMDRAAITEEQDRLGPMRPAQRSTFQRTPQTPINPTGFDEGMGPPSALRSSAMVEQPVQQRPTVDQAVRGQIVSRADSLRTDADFSRAEEFLAKQHPDVLAQARVQMQGMPRRAQAQVLKEIAALAGPYEQQQKAELEFGKIQAQGEVSRKNMLTGISARDRARGKNSRLEEIGRQVQEARKNGDLAAVARLEAEAEAMDPGGVRFPRPPSMVVQPTLDQRDAGNVVSNFQDRVNKTMGFGVMPNQMRAFFRAKTERSQKSLDPLQTMIDEGVPAKMLIELYKTNQLEDFPELKAKMQEAAAEDPSLFAGE